MTRPANIALCLALVGHLLCLTHLEWLASDSSRALAFILELVSFRRSDDAGCG